MNTVDCMDKDLCIDVLRTLYLRIMSLKFNHQYVSALLFDPCIENECPDMADGLIWMFACDSYITVSGMFSHGLLSFERLSKDAVIANMKYDTELKLNSIIPNFKSIRNRMFAHFMDKRDLRMARLMFDNFEQVFCIIVSFHQYCCYHFNISESDIGGYSGDVFRKMTDRMHSIISVIMNGYMDIKSENCI